MRKLLITLLFIASPIYAEGNYGFADSKLNDEFDKNYYEHNYPNWVNATGSSATIKYLNVTSVTVNGANYGSSGPSLSSTQTWTGANTYTGALVASTGTINSFMVVGTITNDNAPEGRFGQYISSAAVGSKPATTTNQFGDFLSFSIPPGDWDISTNGCWTFNDSTNTQFRSGISVTTGNSGLGLGVDNGNFIVGRETVVANDVICQSIPVYRVSIAAATTHYYKYFAIYPGAAPTFNGIIHARRVR